MEKAGAQRHAAARVEKLKLRSIVAMLLIATLLTIANYLFVYVPKHRKAGEPVVALPNYVRTYFPIQGLNQTAHVVPDSQNVRDAPAGVRAQDNTIGLSPELMPMRWVTFASHDWEVRFLEAMSGTSAQAMVAAMAASPNLLFETPGSPGRSPHTARRNARDTARHKLLRLALYGCRSVVE